MAKRKRRKLTKAQARAEARRRKRRQQITWAVAGTVAAAVIVVLVLIAMGGDDGGLVEVEPLRDDIETGLTEEGYPYRGSADAPVTLLEFSDYNCPHCRDFALDVIPLVDDEFIASGQVKYVIQPYALYDWSLPIVEAAACARDQDGFWDFHHWAFANSQRFPSQRSPSRGLLRELASASGLDVDGFDACLDEGRHRDDVLASKQDAEGRLGIDRTPTIFVNGVRTSPTLPAIREAVQAAQAAGSSEQE